MPLRTIPLTQITADDLQRLVDDGVIEGRQLDYEDGDTETYVQVFRNGTAEFCDTRMLRPRLQGDHQIQDIPSTLFESEILQGTRNVLDLLVVLGVPLPYVIFLTLVGVRGYVMALSPEHRILLDEPYPIDRDNFYVPGQIVSRRGGQVDPVLKPMLDAVWNAAGFARSPNFNNEGVWSPPRR